MKLTGVILVILGLIGCAVCVFYMAGPDKDVALGNNQSNIATVIIPLAITLGAVVVGALMMLFGGRGFLVSYNPKVRN